MRPFYTKKDYSTILDCLVESDPIFMTPPPPPSPSPIEGEGNELSHAALRTAARRAPRFFW